jgi:hypothetical protein
MDVKLAMSAQGANSEDEGTLALAGLDQAEVSVQDPPASPKNEQSWAASTRSRLGKAKSLRQAAEGELAKVSVEAHEGKHRHGVLSTKAQSHLRKKIDTTHSLARSLWDRTTGTEDTIRIIGHSIFQLTRAQQATLNPFGVISKCLEMRKTRPVQELVHDHFQRALEDEQAMLLHAQKDYVERMEISRGIMKELEEAKVLLHADMVKKRHATRIDKAALRGPDGVHPDKDLEDHRIDHKDHQEADQLPRVQEHGRGEPRPYSAGKAYSMGQGSTPSQKSNGGLPAGQHSHQHQRNQQQALSARGACPDSALDSAATERWKDHAHSLMSTTHDLCGTASRICVKNDEMLRERQKELDSHRKLVTENMRRRLLETTELKKALEQELRDTDFAITGLEEGLAETERQCELQNVPLKQLKQSLAIRSKKMEGEHVRDTVQIAKEEEMASIHTTMRNLQEQYRRKQTVLAQMTAVRQQLYDDLRCKVLALSIDQQCSKLLTRPHSARLGPAPPAQGIVKPHFRRKNQGPSASRDQQMAATWGPGCPGW